MHSQTWSLVNTGIRLAFAACLLLGTQPARALITSEMSVDVRGAWSRASDGRSGIALLLELNVPLDPQRPYFSHGSLAQDESTTPVDEVPLDPLERDEPDPSDERKDEASEQRVENAAFTAEPPVVTGRFLNELTAAALLAQGCDEAWSRLEGLGSRNRLSALLPEVSLRAGREQNSSLRLTPTDSDPFRYAQSDASNMLLEGRVAWRFGRLLFSSEDLGIERLRLARARERQRVVERTLSVFFQWLHAQVELSQLRKRSSRMRALRWGAAQAAMRLDALTAGWFSAHLTRALPLLTRIQPGSAESSPDPSRAPPTAPPVPQRPEKGTPEHPR